jgi:hypothetical protein
MPRLRCKEAWLTYRKPAQAPRNVPGCTSNCMPQHATTAPFGSLTYLRKQARAPQSVHGSTSNRMPQHATAALSRRLACHRRSARVLRNVPGCTSNRMPQHVTTAQCRRLTCHPQANLGTTKCAGLHQQPHAPVCQNCVVKKPGCNRRPSRVLCNVPCLPQAASSTRSVSGCTSNRMHQHAAAAALCRSLVCLTASYSDTTKCASLHYDRIT